MTQPHNPLDVEGQDKASELRKERNKLAAQTENEDLRWLMGSKRGRRIVWRLLERAGVYRLSFNTNSMQMAFNEGVRNEGLRTLAQVHASCPDLYTTMLKESQVE